MDDSTKNEKGFFKIFNPETSSQRLKIPASFTMYKNGKLPEKVALRDKYGNMWPIGLAKIERDLYFQEGWDKFTEENSVENGDFFIFDYDGNGVFDFKLLGRTGCQKRGAGGLKSAVKSEDEEEEEEEEEEEMNKHQNSEEPKVMNFDMDSDSIISSSDSDEDYMVEEDDEEDEEYEVAEQETEDEATEEEEEEEASEEEKEANEKTVTLKRKAPPSKAKCKRVTAIRTDLPEEEEEEEETEEEEENENAERFIFKKRAPHSKVQVKNRLYENNDDDEEVENEEEEEEQEENEKQVTLKRKASHSKAKRKRAAALKKKDIHEEAEEDTEEDEEEADENESAVIFKRKSLHSKAKCKRATAKDVPEEAEEDTEEEGDENENAVIFKEKTLHSKVQVKKHLYEENDEEEEYEEAEEERVEEEDEEEEEEEEETAEEEEENEMQVILESKGPHSKAKCGRAKETKKREFVDYYGADIFKSGLATQPKNPYFVARVHAKRRDMLYIPADVLKDYNIELPSKMTIRDSAGREFEAKLKIWKDGRIWLTGGWGRLCRWNLVEKKDRCICEFVRGKGKRGLYLQVQVLHEEQLPAAARKNNK